MKLTLRAALRGSLCAAALVAGFSGSAGAAECLLDTNDDGMVDAADTDGGATSDGTGDTLACGAGAEAVGDYSTAIGANSSAAGSYGVTVGNSARSGGPGSIAVGAFAESGNSQAIAVGSSALASGNSTIAIGAQAYSFYDDTR